ncbi:MAG: uracil-DNA glycosylase [Parcubacteria group bacterium]
METQDDRTEKLREVRDEVWNLKSSPLYEERIKNRNFAVIGEGNHHASIMFIGEAPGRNEAATGRPFCGAAGKILDELLASAGIERQSVYITNIVKDRPPGNRDPFPNEIEIYAPFLDRQIEIIQPKAIATLGRFSMDYIMRKFGLEYLIEPISRAHGREFGAETEYGKVRILPLYHPAVAVYDRTKIGELEKDFKQLSKYV